VGVHDLIDTAQIASNTVNRTGFTVLIYFSVLALFFAYCYPISRLTQRLERRYAFS
jgi:polar amino acid transport system permease protein